MRALLWKEFRENRKWGALLLAISFIAQFSLQEGYRDRQMLFQDDYAGMMWIGCGSAAVLLGFLQMIGESARDRWAFLMHRALSPGQILLAKAIVGLSLYLMAALIPLALLTAWCAIPGVIAAPWHWTLPTIGIELSIACIPFWFAGVLTVVREVRWYGTRLLVIALPFGGSVLCFIPLVMLGPAALPIVLAITAMMTVLMALLVRNAMASRTSDECLSRLSRGSLGLSGGISWCILLLTGTVFLVEMLTDTFPTLRVATPAVQQFNDDGTLVENSSRDSYWSMLWLNSGFEDDTAWLNTKGGYAAGSWHAQGPETVRLFFSHRDRVFLAFDFQSRKQIATVTPDGWQAPHEPVRNRFQRMLISRMANVADPGGRWFAFPDGVYRIGITDRQVTRIWIATADEPLLAFNQISDPAATDQAIMAARYATRLRHIRIDSLSSVAKSGLPAPQPSEFITLPAALQTEPAFVIDSMPDQSLVQFSGYAHPDVQASGIRWMVLARRDGHVLSSALTTSYVQRPESIAISMATPPGFIALATLFGTGRTTPQFGAAPLHDRRIVTGHDELFLALGVAGLSVIFVVLLSRRWRMTRLTVAGWLLLTAVFGLSGLLSLIAFRPRLVEEDCSKCHRRRPIRQRTCPHCGAAVEPPPATGTEIIETCPPVESAVLSAMS